MTSLDAQRTELHLAVEAAERKAHVMRRRIASQVPPVDADDKHDHHVDVIGDMADALDRIEPGLGTRWVQAVYAELDYSWLQQGEPA